MTRDFTTDPARERAELDASLWTGRWWPVLAYGITAGAFALTYMIQMVVGLHVGHWWPMIGLLAMATAADVAQLVHQRRLRAWQARGDVRT